MGAMFQSSYIQSPSTPLLVSENFFFRRMVLFRKTANLSVLRSLEFSKSIKVWEEINKNPSVSTLPVMRALLPHVQC